MTKTIENRDAIACELSNDQLDRVNGGTSGMMHAVAAAAYGVLNSEQQYTGFGYSLTNVLTPR